MGFANNIPNENESEEDEKDSSRLNVLQEIHSRQLNVLDKVHVKRLALYRVLDKKSEVNFSDGPCQKGQ